MSLAAAVLVGASAFAVDNIKISGDAQVFYSTKDAKDQTSNALVGKTSGTLFDKDSSAADAALHLNVSADLAKNDLVSVSAGAAYTAISTLGLENNMVSNVWAGSHGVTTGTAASYASASPYNGAKVENSSWMNEAWAAVTAGKTTLKVGRMNLDTPLAFTETWSIESNSFESAVAINSDLPDTTLVGAYVGNGNGTETYGQSLSNTVAGLGLAVGAVVNQNGTFTTYGENGAYAAGIINNSFKPLTVQGWYYDVSKLAQAYWLQADLSMDGIMVGAQYSGVTLEKGSDLLTGLGVTKDLSGDVYAVMVGYEMKDMFTIKGSYSSTGDSDNIGAGFNTATALGTAQSKLYTEAWWNYGYVTESGATAYNVTLEVPVKDIADFGVYYTDVTQSSKGAVLNGTLNTGTANVERKLTEVTVTASRSFGPLDASLVYSNIKATDQNVGTSTEGSAYSQVQAYLTLNF